MADQVRYITGGTLPPDTKLYQERAADGELLSLCLDGQFAYVLTSRQMGKSSLMARTARTLVDQGVLTAIIDLTQIGTRETSAEQWYLGVLSQIESFCSSERDLFDWWRQNAVLPPAQRFSNYMTGVLLKEKPERIVVFVDEIDSTLGLGFTDDFFAAIRAFHNGRATNTDLYRLSFVLLGVATPDELISDRAKTPFNIGQAVKLDDFGLEQVSALIAPLQLGASAHTLAGQILEWTGGQPYLTQKLCGLLAHDIGHAQNLDHLVKSNWLGDRFKSDSHFQFMSSYLANTPPSYKKEVFEVYANCDRGKAVFCRDASFAQNRLRLSGLLKRQDDLLVIRNRIYREIFNRKWIRENRPTFWTERNKKIALYVFCAACLGIAAYIFHLYQLANRLATEATSLRLNVEAKAVLSGSMPGNDAHAMRLSTAAYHILPSNPSYGSLLDTLTGVSAMRWLAEDANPLIAVAISPDGSTIVTGDRVGNLVFWHAQTGRRIREPIKAHTNVIQYVAFSRDGKKIVSSSDDQTIKIWNAVTAQAIGAPLTGHKDQVRGVAFSPDGKRIVSGSLDATLRLWNAETGQAIGEPLKGHGGAIYGVAFSPDGERIVSGSWDKTLSVRDAATGQPIREPLKGHGGGVFDVAFSPDGKRIVSGSADKTLRLWDAGTGQAIGEALEGHEDTVSMVRFSKDGKWIASASDDKTIRIWDAETGQSIGEALKGHEERVADIAFHPNNKSIVSVSNDKTLRLWKAEAKYSIGMSLDGHENRVTSVAYSPDGKRIVSGSTDNMLRLWNAETREPIGEALKGHEGSVLSVAFSPDGKRIVSGSTDNMLRLWNAETREPIGEALKGHEGSVLSVAFSPDGKRIVSGSKDKTLRLWNADTGEPIREALKGHEGSVLSVAFSPDGKRIVSGSADKTLRLWNAETGQPIREALKGHEGSVNSVAFIPDGKRIVSGSDDKTLRFWKAGTGEPIGEPIKVSEAVYAVAFSPDGKRIVVRSGDSALRILDPETREIIGAPIFDRYANSQNYWAISFNPGNQHIATGSGSSVHIWPLPELWIEELCKKLTRNMSHKEWRESVSKDIDYIEQCPGLPVPPDEAEAAVTK